MKKIICIVCLIVLIVFILIFFTKNINKTGNVGNNKSIKEIEKLLQNVDSYKAKISITVKSNKNENTYLLEQEVTVDYAKQTVLEPEIIKGLEILYENNTLTLNNTQLNVSKVYNNYPYISNNVLFLTTFLKKYRESETKTIDENNGTIIMKILEDKNKYYSKQTLIIDKQTLKPKSLEIQDENNNNRVYILYNEIEL